MLQCETRLGVIRNFIHRRPTFAKLIYHRAPGRVDFVVSPNTTFVLLPEDARELARNLQEAADKAEGKEITCLAGQCSNQRLS